MQQHAETGTPVDSSLWSVVEGMSQGLCASLHPSLTLPPAPADLSVYSAELDVWATAICASQPEAGLGLVTAALGNIFSSRQAIAAAIAAEAAARSVVRALPVELITKIFSSTLMQPDTRMVSKQFRQVWDGLQHHIRISLDDLPVSLPTPNPPPLHTPTQRVSALLARIPNVTSVSIVGDLDPSLPYMPCMNAYATFNGVTLALALNPSITSVSVSIPSFNGTRLETQDFHLIDSMLWHMGNLVQLRIDLGDCANLYNFRNLRRLQRLDIVGTAHLVHVMNPDGTLPALRCISVGNVSRACIDAFSGMDSLVSASLYLSTKSLHFLCSATFLRHLYLNTGPHVISLQPLGDLTTLRTLHLSSDVRDTAPIGRLVHITDLAIRLPYANSYAFISDLPDLVQLRMFTRGCQLRLPLPFGADTHPHLRILTMADHRFQKHDPECMRRVGQLTNLRSLDLRGCIGVGKLQLLALSTLTQLSALNLRDCRRPTKLCMRLLMPHLRALTCLQMGETGSACNMSFGSAWVEDNCMAASYTDIPSAVTVTPL